MMAEQQPSSDQQSSPDQRSSLQPISFLVADCGSVTTSVVLLDLVDGVYRLIARSDAPTTVGPPWNDLSVGVKQAISQLTEITGRPLLTANKELIRPQAGSGEGVDQFVLTSSAGPPLSVILVALLENVSMASARRALRSIYARQLDSINLADGRSQQEQVVSILQHQPDLVFISGGTDGGAEGQLLRMVDTIDLAVRLQDVAARPTVAYAGNSQLWEPLRGIFNGTTPLILAENTRPGMNQEEISDAVRLLGKYDSTHRIGASPGIESLLDWCAISPVPTARAFHDMIEFLAALQKESVLGIDLGAGSVTLARAGAGQSQLMVNCELGIGSPLQRLVNEEHVAAIQQWLPVEKSAAELYDYLANRLLFPQTVAVTSSEQLIEQAITRHVLQLAVAEADIEWSWLTPDRLMPPEGRIIIRGKSLTHVPRAAQTVAIVLDALQPTGVFSMAMDQLGVLPALGATALLQPLAAVQTLESGTLVELGWVIVPDGPMQSGQEILEVTLESENIGRLSLEVQAGTIEVLPLLPGDVAHVKLTPHKAVDVGMGIGKERMMTITGGAVGLIVDARGRPLPDLSLLEPDTSRKVVKLWQQQIGA